MALAVSLGSAQAYTVDFEDLASDSFDIDILSDGFQFKSGFTGWVVSDTLDAGQAAFPTTKYLGFGASLRGDGGPGQKIDLPGPGLRMSKDGGGSFDLTGFMAAAFAPGSSGALNVIGNLAGGGTVSGVFSLSDAPSVYSLAFAAVESVDFYVTDINGFQIDNLTDTPNAVPFLPACRFCSRVWALSHWSGAGIPPQGENALPDQARPTG